MSQFTFLESEWAAVFEAASKAEAAVHSDPRTACFYARRALEFVDLIINHLTEHGVVEPTALYESPFTDLTPTGPDALFGRLGADELIRVLDSVRATAQAA